MSELTGRNRPLINRSARRGQALIIVLAVMFVLLFIGTIFIATIGRNIQQSGRSVQTQIANTLAEAGSAILRRAAHPFRRRRRLAPHAHAADFADRS